MKVVDINDFEKLSPLFRGRIGNWLAKLIMRAVAIDKVNLVYEHSGKYYGAEFTSRLLEDIGVDYLVGNSDRLKSLPAGPFITVSNHPYGGLDGIMLIDLFARVRPDYKFMVNNMLSRIKTMNSNFISVNPTGNKKNEITRTNLNAIRETIVHIKAGHPAGFFPSGAVSDYSLKDRCIRDRSWQTSILHLIQSLRVPVLPVRFFDRNSDFFYFLGLINWRIRSLKLPSEVFNKRGQNPRIGIGNLISVREQSEYADAVSLGAFFRKSVYEMPEPSEFRHKNKIFSSVV